MHKNLKTHMWHQSIFGIKCIRTHDIRVFLAGRETSPMIVLSGDWLTDWFTEDM